jgi:hypothetical protein
MSRNHRHNSWKSSSSQEARSLRTEYKLISNVGGHEILALAHFALRAATTSAPDY